MFEEIQETAKFCKGLSDEVLKQKYGELHQSNVQKNIARSFSRFLIKSGDEVVVMGFLDRYSLGRSQAIREFSQFMQNKAFNQSTLISQIKSKRYSKLFQYYLKYYSSNWLLESKGIRDILSHMICIEYLNRSFDNPELLDSLRVYKKNTFK